MSERINTCENNNSGQLRGNFTTSRGPGTVDQEGFRFRNDDGSETTATWKKTQDTSIYLPRGTGAFRLRYLILAFGSVVAQNRTLEFCYKPNGGSFGSWTTVSTSTSNQVYLLESSNIGAGGTTDTTAKLTPPSGKTTSDFVAGKISDDTNPLYISALNNQYTEIEWSLAVKDNLDGGDQIQFRVSGARVLVTGQITIYAVMSGLAYAWGKNDFGQLGDNSVTARSVPTSVSSAISWKQIAGGFVHTVAIDGTTGLAYAWGYNAYGQLGDNSTTSRSVPTSVSSAISWKQIDCGLYYTVAIDGATGLAYAWGRNNFGQLGDNSTTARSVPTSVSSAISWKQINCGDTHTVAINGANGLAYAWGYNAYGQLGDNSVTARSVPTSVSSAISWKQIDGGGGHTAAINGANGLAYAWGDNTYGQLGDNSVTSRSVPTSVSSAISWKQIDGGGYHTLAIDGANGLAYAWGYNYNGQIGDNSTTYRSVPTSVSSAISWKQIAGGSSHTLAIKSADPVTLKYRTGDTYAACMAASWITYTAPFASSGYVQTKVVNSSLDLWIVNDVQLNFSGSATYPLFKYRTATTRSGCLAESWVTWNGSGNSLGYFQVRIEG